MAVKNYANILYILILKCSCGPEKLLGLSRNGPLDTLNKIFSILCSKLVIECAKRSRLRLLRVHVLREELFSSYTKILKMLKLISTRTRMVSKSIELNVIVTAVYGNTVGRLLVLRYRILLISYHRYL